jgi:uncharacterized protein
MGLVNRAIEHVIKSRLASYPAVAIIGPRQSGKTTLAKTLSQTYFDLEQDQDRLRLDLQWDEIFSNNDLVILDEAQCWPDLFTRLRGTIDQQRDRVGRALLLGSVSPTLMTQVSESLAGRLALVELTPLLVQELPQAPVNTLWLHGGYPEGGVFDARRYPRWQLDYLALLVQRDLPSWGLPAKPQLTDRLTKMLAALHGQVWNASQIGQSLGLSYHTVNSYLDYLEGAFLVRRLPAYQANIRKRLVKSPRIYWRDSGLLHALMRVSDRQDLLNQPWVGASWEGFVIDQILGALNAADRLTEAYYLRTSDQLELDLVIAGQRELWALEIKLTSQPGSAPFALLNKTADMIGADKRVLVSQTTTSVEGKDAISCDLSWLLQRIAEGGGPR